MQSGQESQQGGVTYQIATLTPGLAEVMVKDASPQILQEAFHEFLNADMSSANLSYIDSQTMRDMVNRSIMNFLSGIPEDQWDKVKIQEVVWDKDPKTGKPIPIVQKEYNINELWDAIDTKVFVKCCKAKDGFLMRTLTESKSSVNQVYEQRGVPGVPQEQKSGWKFW